MTYAAWRFPVTLALCLGAAFGFAASGDYFPVWSDNWILAFRG